ncbi:MAG: ATP-binding cassette domain-containing protein [Deltaproteobacteria bacterium]|nr:ATP-binding cassette domain-containing protein [Deltaproteobacteria bacterium]
MIKVDNLKKNYKNILALKGVSFEVVKGELFAYLGPNGSGKTTTIRILTGLTKNFGGCIPESSACFVRGNQMPWASSGAFRRRFWRFTQF